jgi:1-phosphofructokinase family hexose kinase
MILILTLNPLLEFRYTVSKYKHAANNRDAKFCNVVGGKGINVSRQLKILGADSFNFLFAGSLYGRKIKELLDQESLKSTTVKTKDDSRTAAIIIEEEERSLSTVFGMNQNITENEAAEFIAKLEKMIQNCEILICSGSSPCPSCDSIFPAALKLAEKYDKISILDTYGSHLAACMESKPTILHNTLSELVPFAGNQLDQESDILDLLHRLNEQGVKQVYLTDGGNAFYSSTFGFSYKTIPPPIDEFDATGSGDAFTAGIAYAHYHDLTFEQGLKLATALGAANALSDSVCCVSMDEAELLSSKVVVEPIGKRMKVLDVTPTI